MSAPNDRSAELDRYGADHRHLVHDYMAALQARMEPAEFEAISNAIHDALHALLSDVQEVTPGGQFTFRTGAHLSKNADREFGILMRMILTGDTHHAVMDVHDDNDPDALMITDTATAKNPNLLARKRTDIQNHLRTHRETTTTLTGIEEASRHTPDPQRSR